MKLTKFAFLAAIALANVAHADFKASYPSIPVKAFTTDEHPMKNFSISYKIIAEKLDRCHKNTRPPYIYYPCYVPYTVEKSEANVVTDANGEATIPAFTIKDSSLTSRNPIIVIRAAGYVVPVKTANKTLNCIAEASLGTVVATNVDEPQADASIKLDEASAQKYTTKTIMLRAEGDEEFMNHWYVDIKTQSLQRDYDGYDASYRQWFIEQNKCK